MASPRRVLAGPTYLLTRRSGERRCLLASRAAGPRPVGYCIALVAALHSLAVHAVMVMSSHWHAVLTAPTQFAHLDPRESVLHCEERGELLMASMPTVQRERAAPCMLQAA